MALEPRTVAVEEGPNPELVDMRRRFWVSTALAVPLLVIAMAGMLPALRQAFAAPWLVWLAARPGDAGGALGRVAVLRARLALDRLPAA